MSRRQEQRALRAIEQNIEDDDPELARLLRSFGAGHTKRSRWYAGATGVVLVLLGANAGSAAILLIGVCVLLGIVLKWTVQAVR